MAKHPDHTASFEYPQDHYLVKVGDTVIVDTNRAILLKEVSAKGAYPPIPYFPLEDVRQEFLSKTEHHTFCPLKGEASYYTLTVNGHTLENSVWYYPEPLEYVSEIDGYVAFYADKVDIVKEGDG
jgi:uncharacterized protein (DUF427 family)